MNILVNVEPLISKHYKRYNSLNISISKFIMVIIIFIFLLITMNLFLMVANLVFLNLFAVKCIIIYYNDNLNYQGTCLLNIVRKRTI